MPGRQSRRSVLATIAVLPSAAALGACGGGPSGAAAARGTGAAAGGGGRRPTRITFWSALRGSQDVVDAFNRTHDTVQVDFQQVPAGSMGGYAKLSNAARAGNAPDVATIEYPQIPGFAIDGVARDITGLVGDRLRAALLPQALGLTTFDRRVFGVPLDVEPMVMHYRTDLFAEYGLPVPRTWAEFEEVARTVRRKAPAAAWRPSPRTVPRNSPRSPGRPAPSGSTPGRAPGTCRSPTRRAAASPRTGSG